MSSNNDETNTIDQDGDRFVKPADLLHGDDLHDEDAAGLAAIGKTPAFARKFNFWTALAITVCINATSWVAGLLSYNYIWVAVVMIGTHILGFFLTMIIRLVMTKDRHDAEFVFTTFINNSDWSSTGISFCVGLTTPMLGFADIEMAAHYAEKIQQVRTSRPRRSHKPVHDVLRPSKLTLSSGTMLFQGPVVEIDADDDDIVIEAEMLNTSWSMSKEP
ncbi:hypothetical protein EDB80DRAFT_880559 [Ilyonectria destructans]|nr:hypothetical protein EDB80DRAFT_880559 [Ilyonectria destructans]